MFRLFLRSQKPVLQLSGALLLLLGLRFLVTGGSVRFCFLVWNLFLALLPLLFSTGLRRRRSLREGLGWALLWLLFLPNATYLITDLVHLRPHSGGLYWLELALLGTGAVGGTLAGLLSLRRAEGWLAARLGLPAGAGRRLLRLALLAACAYGMYLGRVERWNSWDVLTQPAELLQSVAGHLRHPFRHAAVWEFTLLFGALLTGLYSLLLRRRPLA